MCCYTKPALWHVRSLKLQHNLPSPTWIIRVNVVNLGALCECEFHNMAPWQALLNSGLAWMSNKQQELTEALQQFVFLLGSSNHSFVFFSTACKEFKNESKTWTCLRCGVSARRRYIPICFDWIWVDVVCPSARPQADCSGNSAPFLCTPSVCSMNSQKPCQQLLLLFVGPPPLFLSSCRPFPPAQLLLLLITRMSKSLLSDRHNRLCCTLLSPCTCVFFFFCEDRKIFVYVN